MAETTAGGRPDESQPRRDLLLATKLHVPRSQPGMVARLRLADPGGNDPVRFWRHVLTALDAARPGIAGRVGPLAGPPPPPSYDTLVSALINDVAADPARPDVLLILDDYHLISSDSVHGPVRFLLEHRPPQAQRDGDLPAHLDASALAAVLVAATDGLKDLSDILDPPSRARRGFEQRIQQLTEIVEALSISRDPPDVKV